MKVLVTLKAIDGSMSISGNLRAVEDGNYVLQTNLGEMRLPTAMVSCEIIPTDKPKERIVRLTNPDGTVLAEIDLRTYGSGSAFKALAAHEAEIGMADRRMKDGDQPVLAGAGVPDLRGTSQETVLSVDGIVVMVHPDNPVRHLTTEPVSYTHLTLPTTPYV